MKIFKLLFFVSIYLLTFGNILSQNGKIIKKETIVLPDSVVQELNNPLIKDIQSKVELSSITYESDGLKINGFLAIPKEDGTYPVVIFNRGGNRDFGALNNLRATFFLGQIASWGYVVTASNYRGGGGSEGMEEFGGKDVNDIHNLVPMLANLKMADTARMGIYGWSRGGLMTYRTLAESCKFKAAIIGAGVANSFRNIEKRPELETNVYSELIPNYAKKKEEALTARSATMWTEKLCNTTPIMLLHGSADWRVSPLDALEMANLLYKKKHPFRLHFYEGGDHGLTEYRTETSKVIKEFLDHYVRDVKPLPNMEPHGN
jgi:dipeptidyl aminopeptidase/acylaminoacyl peptidase